MTYQAPVRDHTFLLRDRAGDREVLQLPGFADALGGCRAIL
jgi:hypothetical protein